MFNDPKCLEFYHSDVCGGSYRDYGYVICKFMLIFYIDFSVLQLLMFVLTLVYLLPLTSADNPHGFVSDS